MNETWVIIRLQHVNEHNVTYNYPILALLGYHSSTKEQLHNYGPFINIEELREFAKLHQIDLTSLESRIKDLLP